MPMPSRTSRLTFSAMATGAPNSRYAPDTSRNASSSEMGSTVGVIASRISRNRFECARYDSKSGGMNTASGQRRRARTAGMAFRIPYARAS
jgi:hypothetical protein